MSTHGKEVLAPQFKGKNRLFTLESHLDSWAYTKKLLHGCFRESSLCKTHRCCTSIHFLLPRRQNSNTKKYITESFHIYHTAPIITIGIGVLDIIRLCMVGKLLRITAGRDYHLASSRHATLQYVLDRALHIS